MVFQFTQDQAFLISSCYVLPQFWHIFFSHILAFIPCVLYTLYIFNVILKNLKSRHFPFLHCSYDTTEGWN